MIRHEVIVLKIASLFAERYSISIMIRLQALSHLKSFSDTSRQHAQI